MFFQLESILKYAVLAQFQEILRLKFIVNNTNILLAQALNRTKLHPCTQIITHTPAYDYYLVGLRK